jgi:ubiquinone biosynthesis protein
MSFFSIPRTYGNLMRARQIAGVLAQHGFGHILSRLRLVDHIPGMGRIRVLVEGRHAADKDAPPEERLAHAMEELGATFIKLGQMLATRPDIVPPAYVKAFCRLQDRVEPFPGEESVKVIEASLGKKLNEVFRTFDPKPVASGSIGQVHFAELIDGSEVIVKVKRPGTDQKVRDDLDILKWLAELAESHIDELGPFKPVEFCEEFSHTMRRELDFVAEAAYTAKAREILKDEPLVIVPRIHWDFATRNVMVQERIHGIPLSNPDTMNLPFEKRQRIAAALGGAFMNQFFLAGLFHADPHPGNIFLLEDGRIALLDFGQAGHLSDELRHHLGLILVSLTQREFDTIADVYADMGGLADETDMQQFKSHMISLIDRYYGVPVDRIDFSSLFEEVLTMGRQHHISIPRDLVVLPQIGRAHV